MKVCFVANKHLTITFASIARHLESVGHEVYWASPSRRWTKWLQDSGVGRSRILSLPDFADEWRDGKADPDELASFESERLPTCHNILMMCRALREIRPEAARAYLLTVMRRFGEFATGHGIELVLSEGTWGFELAVALSSAHFGILWLAPNSTRIPDDRFGFFRPYPHVLPELQRPAEEDRAWASSFYEGWVNRPRPPVYSRKVRSPVAWRSHWLGELRSGLFASHLSEDDHTVWPLSKRISRRLQRGVASTVTRLMPPFQAQTGRPFVLMCLHLQPEASVDVVGAFHSDQGHAVARIARLLPATHELWVKEHPDAPGSRPPAWHQRLKAIPNVVLIEPYADTFDLCRRASLVLAVSGTVAYESALMGTPAATLAPIFFGPILSVDAARQPDPLCWNWSTLLHQRPPPEEVRAASIEFLAWIHAQSFPGMPFDPEMRRLIGRDPDDVRLEAAGFETALRRISVLRSEGRLGPLPERPT